MAGRVAYPRASRQAAAGAAPDSTGKIQAGNCRSPQESWFSAARPADRQEIAGGGPEKSCAASRPPRLSGVEATAAARGWSRRRRGHKAATKGTYMVALGGFGSICSDQLDEYIDNWPGSFVLLRQFLHVASIAVTASRCSSRPRCRPRRPAHRTFGSSAPGGLGAWGRGRLARRELSGG